MCSCGGGTGAGRRVKTSGDYNAPLPTDDPLAVIQLDGGDHDMPPPAGAQFTLLVGAELRFFADHGPAFRHKQRDGGKIRRVAVA